MMKLLFYILLLSLNFSCQGQEKNEKKTSKPEVKVNAEKEFKKQNNRFEIKGYQLFFNEQVLKSDTIESVFKILGKPEYPNDLYYTSKPVSLTDGTRSVKDKDGHALFINQKDGKTYSLTEANIEEFNEYGKAIMMLDNEGDKLKIITKYRIIFKKHKPSYIPSNRDSLLMQIPAVEVFVKINGFYIDKNTKREELVAKLKPTVKNADFFNSRGTISTWYYATENDEPLTKFDPRIRPSFDGYIRIDYVYFDDELYSIDYYYTILE